MTTTHIRPDWVVPPSPLFIGDIYRVVGYPFAGAVSHGATYRGLEMHEIGRWEWFIEMDDGDCFRWADIEHGDIMADKVELVRRNPLPAREHNP